jgi:hypothetical protein
MKNLKLFFFLILLINLMGFSQNIVKDSIPKDPLMPSNCEIVNYNFDFLIKDNTSYLCYVNKIYNLKNGYIINVKTKIDSIYVTFYITSSKTKNISSKNKIKEKHKYYLTLKRYFEYPICAGIEVYSNENIMIGDKMVNVGFPGSFYYLFISDNLDGLYYLDSNLIHSRYHILEKQQNPIDSLIFNFINEINIPSSNNITTYVDSNNVKKMFQNYCFPYGQRKLKNSYSYSEMLPHYKIKLEKWETFGINPNSFQDLFDSILWKEYKLPLKNRIYNQGFKLKILKQDILNISEDSIYTYRVDWKNEGSSYFSSIILSIKQIDNKFKIIGINTVYVSSYMRKIIRDNQTTK